MITIQLKPRNAENVLRFHPWLFSGAIARINGKPEAGDLVRVVDCEGNFLAIGHYQIGSIMIRILTFQDEPIDRDFWKERLVQAYKLRQALRLTKDTNTQTNAFRLIHGEGDNLPGLVIDIYDSTAVLQAHSVGMHMVRQVLAELLVEVVEGVENVYYKSESTLPFKAPIEVEDGYLIGHETETIAMENGLKFYADWLKGQKTGFFIDQRDNRFGCYPVLETKVYPQKW